MAKDICKQHIMPTAEARIRHLLAATDVPGIASAVIRAGQLERTICGGVRDVRSRLAVDEDTVFDAASLSKPVFAHAVLQLADQGILSLDAPLTNYLPGYIPADERASLITARQVLSHSAGLPNWRNDDLPLKTYFAPGKRFSYSGKIVVRGCAVVVEAPVPHKTGSAHEGFLYLQKVTEVLTGEKLHDLVERLVLQPFGMSRTSFVWDWRFDHNRATPHDDFGRPRVSWKPGEGNAAATLQTTVADYARFLLHVMDGSQLQPETSQLWLRPHIEVRRTRAESLKPEVEEVSTGVAWD